MSDHLKEDNNQTLCGVLDLGTNTFHMIVHRVTSGYSEELFRKRHIVFLSDQGIETISDAAKKRAKNAVIDFAQELKKFGKVHLKIIGTAALRTASNGPEIADFIGATMGAPVEVISGKREAELIGKGVLYSMKNVANGLVVDIGGGSVEFIHILNNKIVWSNSYPVGIGVLYKKFQHSEPINPKEIDAIKSYLSNQTEDLLNYIHHVTIDQMIGASGSFELLPKLTLQVADLPDIVSYITKDAFVKTRNTIWSKNVEERRTIPNLPEMRVQLSVVSFIIMDWILENVGVDKIWISKYAVKEGVIAEIIDSSTKEPS